MLKNNLTIVMYHYVRPIKNSKWPRLKGLELDGFVRQLDYLSKNFTFVTAEDIINASKGEKSLPSNSCWLTFDDGYKDHITYVFPELSKRKIQGSFFPPVKATIERKLLDVNAIHYILASTNNYNELIQDLNDQIRDHGFDDQLIKNLSEKYAVADSYDRKEVVYVKALLQHVFPETISRSILFNLLKKYVGLDQDDLADQLYMTEEDIKKLVSSEMYIGSHGFRHSWLNKVPKRLQKFEIDQSKLFLERVGAITEDWIMCYPYGAYNNETLELLAAAKCRIGLTTRVGLASLDYGKLLELPRFDTNEFPQ